jgi:adenylate cyclase
MLAFAILMSRLLSWTVVAPELNELKEAGVLAARAAELDDSDPWAHLALGYVAQMLRHTEDAQQEYQKAIDLNPNFAAAHGYLGSTLALEGRSDEAIVYLEQAIRMSPHDPNNVIFNTTMAAAHFLADRYTEAISFARKGIQQRSGVTSPHRIYIASLAQAGRIEEARIALQHLKELIPNISIAWCEQHVPYSPGPMVKFLDGLRKAGLE